MGLLEALGLESTKGATGAPVASAGAKAPPKAPPKELTDYIAERAAVKKLVEALDAHPQTSHLSAEKAQIAVKLASAAAHAPNAEWVAAMKDLADARALCAAAKKLADDWQAYAKQLATTRAQTTSLIGLADALVAQQQAIIATAEAQVASTPPNFTAAMATLATVFTKMAPQFKARVDSIKAALAKLEALTPPIQAFIHQEIANGKASVTQADAALAGERWSELMIAWRAAWTAIGPAGRYGERRALYDTQRATTQADIAAVKALPAVADQGPSLDKQQQQADTLASHDQLKMEEGAKLLVEVSKRCAALQAVAPTVASHDAERKAADAELAALAKHAAAAQVAAPLAQAGKLLAAAAATAVQARANAVDPTVPWQSALTQVQRARADLATAKALADNLGSAAGAKTAAGGTDAAAMQTAIAAMKVDLGKANAAPFAGLVKKPLDRCTARLADAEKALAKKDAKTAGKALGEASEALVEGRTIQAQHAQFEATLTTLDARLKILQALPTAKAIGARIEAVGKAIEAAKKQDKGADGAGAMTALRTATDAAAAADQADRDRRAYDTEAKRVSARIAAEVADPKAAKPIAKVVEDAGKLADAFKFDDGRKALKRAEVQIAELKLKAGMKTTPPDPKLKDIAAQMVADGGAASVDAAIQNSPEGSPDVITALASGRYGKPFKFEDAVTGPQHVKAMKRVCEIFAKIPDDLANNPSIKDVSHADAVGSAGGGYTSSSAHIGMTGRVGIQQEFGNKETNYDPKTGKEVKSLPKNLDPDCQPKDGKKMEYLGFAAAHEVGHGVDDKRGFMAKNGSLPKYGGWKTYGASVQPVADAVGADVGGKFASSTFYKTPETKKYVLDKLMSRPAQRPPAAAGSDDFKALDAFDKWYAVATSDDVYRRQSDCDFIKIGALIYHEAYPRSWVSYLAEARTRGLTGYQFRAPGEWFAELYAGWKSGKLGPKHPALDWLTKL